MRKALKWCLRVILLLLLLQLTLYTVYMYSGGDGEEDETWEASLNRSHQRQEKEAEKFGGSRMQDMVAEKQEISQDLLPSPHQKEGHATEADTYYENTLRLEDQVQQDIERCSLNLGLSEYSLIRASNDISTVSKKVSSFLRALWSVVPRKFSPKYKNPCWIADDLHMRDDFRNKRLFCLPYFFLSGFIKTGTTTLHGAFLKHPEIAPPKSKEFHWWSRLPLASKDFGDDIMHDSIVGYIRNFTVASKMISTRLYSVTYDGSADTIHDAPYYMNSQDYCVLPLILSKVLPNLKIIVIMRNPITRTYSNFLYACTEKYEWNAIQWPADIRRNAPDIFHEQVLVSIKNFNECLKDSSLFECTNLNNFKSQGLQCGEVGFRLTVSLYYIHIAKWMEFFPREQFLFLRTEDMSLEPHKFMSETTNFLSLSPVSSEEAASWLSKKANNQSHVLTVLQRKYDFSIQRRTERVLEDFFKPYNTMLAELVGDNRFLWAD